MATLVPSILTRDAEEVREKLRFLESIPELSNVQIDFADGKFVQNELCYPKQIGPIGSRLAIEAHLMTRNPQDYFHDLEAIGAKTVFVHYESFHSHDHLRAALRNGKHMGFGMGLAINPGTGTDVFDLFAGDLDEMLLMGVIPGFQGQRFISATLDRLTSLRKIRKNAIIEIDGGVKLDNIESIVAHGADKINVGSGIWHSPDPRETIYKFLEKLSK